MYYSAIPSPDGVSWAVVAGRHPRRPLQHGSRASTTPGVGRRAGRGPGRRRPPSPGLLPTSTSRTRTTTTAPGNYSDMRTITPRTATARSASHLIRDTPNLTDPQTLTGQNIHFIRWNISTKVQNLRERAFNITSWIRGRRIVCRRRVGILHCLTAAAARSTGHSVSMTYINGV